MPDNPASRILLVAPANSYRTFSYIESARRLGVEAVVASQGEHALVAAMAGGIHVNLQRRDALEVLLASARERPFAGVVATDDTTVELASRVAAALGLSHNPAGAARFSRRKDLARACLRHAGCAVPEHRVLDLAKALAPQLRGLRFPCVVKPLALSASRGVIRADDGRALAAACDRIGAMLATEPVADPRERDHVLVETFIAGPEVAVEGLLHRGSLNVLAVFDKPDPMEGPFFEETYYVTPSRLPAGVQEKLTAAVAAACSAYGLREGPVHAELRLTADVPCIMEVASRTIGGHCGRLLRFGTGHHLEDLVIAQAIGEPLSMERRQGAAGILMIPIPQAGVLRRVEGILAAQRIPFVEEVEISIREGYELVPLPEGDRYLGFMFSLAPTPAEAEQALRAAQRLLKVVVAPLWRLSAGAQPLFRA